MSLILFFEKLNKITIFLTVFLIPLFFFPYSQDVLNFPKQNIFLLLIFISLIGWLGKGVLEKKIIIKGEKIFYITLLFIIASFLLSLLKSPSYQLSFWGNFLDISDSFLSTILFIFFVFLLINSFETKSEILSLFFILTLSAALVGFFNLFQMYKIFVLPFNFAKTIVFNTVGTPSTLLLFEVIIFPISFFLFFRGKGLFKIISGIILLIILANIILINFKIGWLVFLFEIFFLFIFLWGRFNIQMSFFLFLMVLIILGVFFYFFPITLPSFPLYPPEASLRLPTEIHILKGVLSSDWKKLVFGSGPGTFVFEYSLYRPPLLNQSIFWGTRFLKGNSSFFDWFITKGLFGGAVLTFFFILIIFYTIKFLIKKEELFDTKIFAICSLFATILSFFIYPFNFTLFFLFWFFVGSVLFFVFQKRIHIDLSLTLSNLLFNFFFILIFICGLVTIFQSEQFFLAEFRYIKGIEKSQSGNLDQTIELIKKATVLNPNNDTYWRDLSQIYLAKAILLSQNNTISFEQRRPVITKNILDGGEAINKAVSIAPFNVANWNVRGYFYQNLVGVEKAEAIALDSYQKAIELEPSSPYPYTEKARVYILFTQNLSDDNERKKENLNLAINNLNKALELKPDYGPAHYLLAVAFDQLGKQEEAISKLEETKLIAPNDLGLAFQLGLLYWRKGDIEKAQAEFERAININSDYANARYMLGLVYDKKGDREKALREFEFVAKLDPTNSQVKKILDNLRSGLPALEGVLPLQENPPEIK